LHFKCGAGDGWRRSVGLYGYEGCTATGNIKLKYGDEVLLERQSFF
jgi:hypothetical protein